MGRSRGFARSLQLLLSVALLFASARAGAAEQTVAVLGVEAVNAPAELAASMATALKNRVLRTAGFRLVQGKNLDEVKLVFGCVDEKPTCMARVGRSLQASKLLWGALHGTPTGYTVTIRFLDVRAERIDKLVSEPITKEEAQNPSATIDRLTASFLIPSQGTIKLTTNVSGAQVLLGEMVKGTTDASTLLLQEVPIGTHLLQIRMDGYHPWSRRVTVGGGQTIEVNATLAPLEVVKPPEEKVEDKVVRPPPKDTRKSWKIAFWTGAAVTVGVAAAMAVTGVSVLGLEDDKEIEVNKLIDDGVGDNGKELDEATLEALASSGANACAVAEGNSSKLRTICDDGNTRATIFNALLGVGVLTAVVSAYFLYQAYIASPDKPDEDDDDDVASRIRFISGAGPDGAHLGISLQF